MQLSYSASFQQVVSRFLLVAFAWLLVACDDGSNTAANERDMEIGVMSFNIEWGGKLVSFDNVIKTIEMSGADIVGIQEAEGNLAELAGRLGWFHNSRNYVISRYPVIEPGAADGRYVLVEVAPGLVVAIVNIHLPSDPYGPDLLRDGASLEEVLALERQVRLPKLAPFLEAARDLAARDIPVYLTGDFNAPPHTDWTAAEVAADPTMRYAIEWPVSKAVAEAGLQDSWRAARPDVSADPGFTWFAHRPPLEEYTPSESAGDRQARIDFVWHGGPSRVVSSMLAAEADNPESAFSVAPWPSDHRAVVSRFNIVPAEMPSLIAARQRINMSGDDVEVLVNLPAGMTGPVQLVKLAPPEPAVDISAPRGRGLVKLESSTLSVGHYRLAARAGTDPDHLYAEFWVVDPAAEPVIEAGGVVYAPGETIRLSWRHGPGHRNDYIAVAPVDAPSAYELDAAWTYIDARPAGEISLDASTAEAGWPLAPGTYTARLVKDDGYEALAVSRPFTVR